MLSGNVLVKLTNRYDSIQQFSVGYGFGGGGDTYIIFMTKIESA